MVAVRALPSTGFRKNAAHPFCRARSSMTVSWLEVVTMIGGAEPRLQLAAREQTAQRYARRSIILDESNDHRRLRRTHCSPSVTSLQRTPPIHYGAASP